MFMFLFSLVWIIVISFAGAFAWIEYWLTDTEDSPEIPGESTDWLVADHPIRGYVSATVH